ncbi:predicted protein [Methanosarcina acetivorans C2A]|uniref:Uncharacterized protein n=1 Tax=Methanosarcina acetivorans (strain ATCC 35395 / DSM 2834 / JCM 12185 / C2A) TaxID=188937 RepID=Q8TJI1_METAC|nr:predicted protein [Methanosarcina acetivorans C2A]
MITNAGKEALARRAVGVEATAEFDYIGTGTGSSAAADTDTALESENNSNGAVRTQGIATYPENYKGRVVITLTITGNVTIREMGIFNAASGGTLLARGIFTEDQNYTAGQQVQITGDTNFTSS